MNFLPPNGRNREIHMRGAFIFTYTLLRASKAQRIKNAKRVLKPKSDKYIYSGKGPMTFLNENKMGFTAPELWIVYRFIDLLCHIAA